MDPELTAMAEKITLLESTIEQMQREGADSAPRPSRRLLLRGAAVAAGGAVLGALAHGQPAAAANNDPIQIGNLTNTGTAHTQANCTGVTTTGTAFLFQSGSSEFATTVEWNAALSGVASNGSTRTGVYGRSDLGNGAIGVLGHCTVAFKSTGVLGYGVTGVQGISTSGTGIGVFGRTDSGPGVHGDSLTGPGVEGVSDSAAGVKATATSGPGVLAASTSGTAVQADSASGIGVAATGATGVVATGVTGVLAIGAGGAGIAATGVLGAYTSGTSYAYAVAGANTAALHLSANDYVGTTPKLPPPARTDAHLAGEIDFDANNELWLCTSPGSPGTWRKIAGTSTAGAFHPVVPGRLYDSRVAAPGPIARLFTGQTRLVNVAARRDLASGAGIENNYVPAGASAIACNVTVVDTIGAGFLSINPGGVTEVRAATVNWFGSGQILNNGVTLTLNAARELTVIAGGDTTAGTHFVIDVTGYYR